jgi:hypothetical protein
MMPGRVIAAAVLVWAGAALGQVRTAELDPGADPRGAADLVLCSQNLHNYGDYASVKIRMPGITPSGFRVKEQALVRRFVKAGCDVIAVQEIVAGSELEAGEVLKKLAEALRFASNRFFEPVVGASNDKYLRLGFLIARDRVEVVNKVSYADVELPKMSENQKPRQFPRGPLEVQLNVKPSGEGTGRIVTVITFHFKSKASGGGGDPTGLEFEPYRMEMAEALRRIVELRHAEALGSGRTILVLLGDRNSNFDVASARILEGVLGLKQFQGEAPCRLSKRGMPLCKAGSSLPQRLFSVLTSDPQVRRRAGTFRHKNVYSWLDDIIMPAESLPFAWAGAATPGDYDSGVEYDPGEASDHAMVWVRLNW